MIAEDSLFLWHQMRLLQFQQREPEHLAAGISSARAVLATAQRLNGELVTALYSALSHYGAIKPLELHRLLSRNKLRDNLAALRAALEEFAAFRNAQVSAWPEIKDPTFEEAVAALQEGARDVATAALSLGGDAAQATDRALGRLGARLQQVRGSPDPDSVHDAVPDETSEPPQ